MWVGTDAGGLNLYDPETNRFHTFRHSPDVATSLADDTIYSLTVDADGTVWVGTRGGTSGRTGVRAFMPVRRLRAWPRPSPAPFSEDRQ